MKFNIGFNRRIFFILSYNTWNIVNFTLQSGRRHSKICSGINQAQQIFPLRFVLLFLWENQIFFPWRRSASRTDMALVEVFSCFLNHVFVNNINLAGDCLQLLCRTERSNQVCLRCTYRQRTSALQETFTREVQSQIYNSFT